MGFFLRLVITRLFLVEGSLAFKEDYIVKIIPRSLLLHRHRHPLLRVLLNQVVPVTQYYLRSYQSQLHRLPVAGVTIHINQRRNFLKQFDL